MWEEHYKRLKKTTLSSIPWVREYLPQLRQFKVHRILDIGCGTGAQVQYLMNQGFDVIGTDYAQSAIDIATRDVPNGDFLLWDTRNSFPFSDAEFDMILASLSLHYFGPPTLSRIISEISRLLSINGLFLFRLNSIHDARANEPQIVERYYFSLDDCRKLLEEWKEIVLKERLVQYYGKSKLVCEGCYSKS
jgi:SAM-dependent methyltransferase